jgi:hypothetical protein
MLLLTAGVFAIWRAQTRNTTLWQRWFKERAWLRAMTWTATLTTAAGLGCVLSWRNDVAVSVVAVGVVALMLLAVFWSFAKSFGSRDER